MPPQGGTREHSRQSNGYPFQWFRLGTADADKSEEAEHEEECTRIGYCHQHSGEEILPVMPVAGLHPADLLDRIGHEKLYSENPHYYSSGDHHQIPVV